MTPPNRDPRNLRKVASDFWFAVQRMILRPEDSPHWLGRFEPPPDNHPDNDLSESGVPRSLAPSSGSAGATVPEPSSEEPE